MTTWDQTFAQNDAATLDGILGFTLAQDGSGGGDIELFNTFATPSVNDEVVVATQTTTVPTTHNQEISVLFASSTEEEGGRNYSITCGTFTDGTGASWGVGARFTYGASGLRTLDIIADSGGGVVFGGSPASFLTKDVTSLTETADVAGSGVTDLLVLQEMRFIVTTIEGGMRLRAYINEDDDDQPTLEYRDYRDPHEYTGSTFGSWYFAFGDSFARALKLSEVHARDYEEKIPEAIQLGDRHSLSEIRANVLTRVDGSSVGTDRASDTAFMNELINSTVEEIIDEVGDVALFMQPVEEMTLTVDADRVATLPAYVDRVFTIVEIDKEFSTPWHFLGYTTDETVQVIFEKGYDATSGRHRVHYQMKYQRMDADDDLCIIPRRFTEAVVYGTILRIAEYDTNDSLHQQTLLRYQQKLKQIKQAMNRVLRTSKGQLRARRRVVHIPFGKHLTTPITGF